VPFRGDEDRVVVDLKRRDGGGQQVTETSVRGVAACPLTVPARARIEGAVHMRRPDGAIRHLEHRGEMVNAGSRLASWHGARGDTTRLPTSPRAGTQGFAGHERETGPKVSSGERETSYGPLSSDNEIPSVRPAARRKKYGSGT